MATGSSSAHHDNILHHNRFPDPIVPGLTDYCDLHDLIAVVSRRSQKVLVYRINGQLAFAIERKDDECDVSALNWKPDGNLLSVGWSDGSCGVYSGEDGKLLTQSYIADATGVGHGSSSVCCIGWTLYGRKERQAASSTVNEGPGLTSDTWDEDARDSSPLGIRSPQTTSPGIPDLIRAIATIDVTQPLPLLSPLPTHVLRFGLEEKKFTSQVDINSLLDVSTLASEHVSTLVATTTAGNTAIYLNDNLKMGGFDVPSSNTIRHASNIATPCQVILAGDTAETKLKLYYIDVPLPTLGGPMLQFVAMNTKRMQHLVAYVALTVECIHTDFNAGLQLPSRLISYITEELEEKQETDLVSSLYHLTVTATFTPVMLEWLADTVKESTHKRWDKSINDVYQHIQNHIFINLIPALDRLAIATNSIRGHAMSHQHTDTFVSPEPFGALMDDIDAIRLLAQKLQLIIMKEHRRFKAFSKWLRTMIDIGVAEPGSSAAAEIEERELPNIDDTLVLSYIEDTLISSRLTPHLEKLDGASRPPGSTDRPSVMKAIQDLDHCSNGVLAEATSQLRLRDLTNRLTDRTNEIKASITHWQSKMLPSPQSIELNDLIKIESGASILDMALNSYSGARTNIDTITCLLMKVAEDEDGCQVLLQQILRLPTGHFEVSEERYNLPGGDLLHAVLLQEDRCLALVKGPVLQDYALYLCDFRRYREGLSHWTFPLHAFELKSAFLPSHFVVGGRPGKMVCVVYSDSGREWLVIDLSAAERLEAEQTEIDTEMI